MSNAHRVTGGRILGRIVASAVLLLFLPALLLFGFLLHANSDEPVLLTDEVWVPGGTKVCIHRFRTIGRGTNIFQAVGRFLRWVGYEDLPALWDVARGKVGVRDFYHLTKKQ